MVDLLGFVVEVRLADLGLVGQEPQHEKEDARSREARPRGFPGRAPVVSELALVVVDLVRGHRGDELLRLLRCLPGSLLGLR